MMKDARMHGGADARYHPRPRRDMALRLAASVLLCAGASVRAVFGQDNLALRTAVQLAAEGRGDSARRIVALELAKASPGAPAYVEALYWRGRLASTGDSAERDLRRVAIEYSTSRWADQALLQLAQLAMAAGNSPGALQLAERLRSDYPTSTLRGRAALWAGRAAFEVGDPATACALLDSARTESANDVEFLNQIAFYRSRCGAQIVAPPPDTARAAAPAAPRGPGDTAHPAAPAAAPTPTTRPAHAESAAVPPPRRAAQFEVQVAATRAKGTAQAVLDRLTRSGEHARIVAGTDGYLRVRAGPYPTEREATAAATRIGTLLGGHPFVVPVP
jgi:cell division septation protein DedD